MSTDRQRFLDGLMAFQTALRRAGIDPASVTVTLQPGDVDRLRLHLELDMRMSDPHRQAIRGTVFLENGE